MRKTNENLILLNTLFSTALVVSNVVTVKLLRTGLTLFGTELALPGAAVCYACTFLITDVIGEIWGRAEAIKSILYGFVAQLFASALILFTEHLPAADPAMQAAYTRLLGQNMLIAAASLAAYFVSQWWDIWLFHRIRDWYLQTHRGTTAARWIWNNASTMTSQAIDTILFIGLVFGVGYGWLWHREMWPTLAATITGQYIFKFLLALLDTPFFYLMTRTSPSEPNTTNSPTNS